jgi:hypothetical protein
VAVKFFKNKSHQRHSVTGNRRGKSGGHNRLGSGLALPQPVVVGYEPEIEVHKMIAIESVKSTVKRYFSKSPHARPFQRAIRPAKREGCAITVCANPAVSVLKAGAKEVVKILASVEGATNGHNGTDWLK